MKIIKERERVTVREKKIHFDFNGDKNEGYMFDADENWNPVFGNDCQKKSYEICINDPRYVKRNAVEEYSYTEPAVGKCVCGREVVLEDTYRGATHCECGRWYNIFGQSLVDPEYWEED